MTDPLSDFGEFADLAELLILKQRLEGAEHLRLDHGDLVWVLPPSLLAGIEQAYGIPVVRADVADPMLAIRRTRAAWRSAPGP